MKTVRLSFLYRARIPDDRIKALKAAFAATHEGPDFLTDIQQLLRKITPTSGADMDAFISAAYAHPPGVIEKMRNALLAGN